MSRFEGRGGPPSIDGMVSLKVDNLSFHTTPDDLDKVFSKYGEIGDIYMPRDPRTFESRGFAFVRFYSKRDADDALDSMDGRVVKGREVRISFAMYGRPSEDRRRPYDQKRRSPPRSSRRRSYSRSRSPSRSRSRDRGGSRRRRSPSPRRSRRSASKSPRQRKRSSSRSSSASGSKSPSRSRSRSPR